MVRKQGRFALSLIVWTFVFSLCLSLGNSGVVASGSFGGKRSTTGATQLTDTGAGFAGVLTWHNDNARDGQNLNETVLTTANVNATQFGKVFSYSVDGQIYAQALYVPNVTVAGFGTLNVAYVVTENDSVYAFDADGVNKTPLWKTSLLNSGSTISSSELGCGVINPNIGITGTPVIDPTTGTLYVVAGIKKNGSDTWQLHALDIATGLDKFGGPVTISATVNGVPFDAKHGLQRGALLLANGTVYLPFGSHCDHRPYHGWLFAYNPTTLAQKDAFLVTPNGGEGSFWNGGGGPSADSSGNLLATTANGTFDANTGGADYGDSFLKLSSTLSVLDYFTPFNQSSLNSTDLDLGTGGVVLPPDQTGSHPHIMIGAGKEGRIYVVDRDNLGHFHSGSDSQIVQSIKGAFPQPAYPSGAYWNGNVYFANDADVLKQYTLTGGLLSTTPAKKSTDKVAYPGSTPSISANGTTNGIVWLAVNSRGGAALRAYNATDVSHKLYDSGTAVSVAATKFSLPTVANGKVYVVTKSELVVFGLL